MTAVIIIGNCVDGVKIVGPFESVSDAVEWTDRNNITDSWVAAPMAPLSDYE